MANPRSRLISTAASLLPVRCRAAEHSRSDVTPLIIDRAASRLLSALAPAEEVPPHQELVDLVAVRTRAIDAWLEQPTWPPTRTTQRQIVLLCAGLDARAYRLGLGQQTTIFEVEADGHLLRAKRDAMAGARLRTRIVDVEADCSDVSQTAKALRAAGLNASVPTRWVYEGPLTSLAGLPAPNSLFELAAECASAPGSRIAAALAEPAWEHATKALGGKDVGQFACLATVAESLEQARIAGWREKRTMRRADVAEMYHRDTHESCALLFAEADPDGS